MVDTTAPATPTLTSLVTAGTSISVTGSTVYFKPGADNTNTFTVTADSTGDPETGLKSEQLGLPGIPGFGAPSISGNQATYTAASPTAGQGGSGNATVQNNALLTSAPGRGLHRRRRHNGAGRRQLLAASRSTATTATSPSR